MKITDNHKKVMDWLVNNGYPLHVASGIGANFQQESTFNPNAVNKDSGAFGLAQWLGERQTDLNKYAFNKRKPSSDLITQLEFMDKELKGNEKKALRALLETKTPEDAAQVFSSKFERAGKHETNDTKRKSFASNLMDFFISTASADETPYAGNVDQGLSDAEMESLMVQQAPAPAPAQEAGLSDAEMESLMVQQAPAPAPAQEAGLSDAEMEALMVPDDTVPAPAPAQSPVTAAQQAPKNTQTQSALKGATQGLTFGFGDEINGAGYAIWDAIQGKNGNLSLADNYAKYRDESRNDFAKAQADNPKTFMAGEVVGNIANPVNKIGAGLGFVRNVAQGAGLGAVNAAGNSNSVSDMPADVGVGAGVGAVGGAVGQAISKVVGPLFSKTTDPEKLRAIQKAKDLNIPLNIAQATGNKSAQTLTSVLDQYPTTSSAQAAAKQTQRESWQRKLLGNAMDPRKLTQEEERAIRILNNAEEKQHKLNNVEQKELDALRQQYPDLHEFANTMLPKQATPEAMGAIKSNLSKSYDDLTSRNNIVVDHELKRNIVDIEQKYLKRLTPNQKSIVRSYIHDFNKAPVGAQIDGEVYQQTRSMLDKQAKSLKTSDPFTSNILKELRSNIDSAMRRNLSERDQKIWDRTNKSWGTMKLIEAAIEPEVSNIKPHILMNKLTKDNPEAVLYGKGDQTLPDLARVGKAFIPDKTPDSGTQQRTMFNNLLTLGAGASGFGLGAYANNGDGWESPIIGAASAIFAPKMIAAYMRNGKLADGLLNIDKAVAGVTGRDVITQTTRQLANQAIKAGTKKKEDK